MDNPTWRRIVSFGSEGTQAGSFSRPWGVAITRYSDLAATSSQPWSIYLIAVADRSNNRIQVFKFDAITVQVTFLHMFGDGPGNRHGQFDRPAGIVFNPTLEQIIVADKDNHRVQIFDLSGSYLFKFGERGSKCGQLNYPWDIDVCSATHNILVSDTRNKRIQIFNNFGRYLAHFNQPLDSPRGVAYFSSSQVLVSDFNKHRLLLISRNEHEDQQVSSTSLTTPNNINNNDIHGTNYLFDNSDDQIFKQDSLPFGTLSLTKNVISRAQPIAAPTKPKQQVQQQQYYESKFIGFGEGSSWGEFLRPQGVTTNGSIVFCSDSRNNRVACCNIYTQSFNYISKDVVDLDRPAGLAAIDNYIVIVDFGNDRIHICQYVMNMDQYTWRLVVTFGTEGTEAGNFCRPWGVAITRYSDLATLEPPSWSKYLIAVADRSNNRIQVFKFDAISQTVSFLHMFGDGPGNRHGQFDRPAGIVFNPTLEQIIVADKDNHRIQVFNLSGSYLFKFGERGSKCGQLNYPWDIDVCKATHNILVSDTRNKRIQIFNNLGRYLAHFNQPLDSPRGVAFLGPSQALVSDFDKHRLVLIVSTEEEQVTSSTSSSIITSSTTSKSNNNNNNNDNKWSNFDFHNLTSNFYTGTTAYKATIGSQQVHHHHQQQIPQQHNLARTSSSSTSSATTKQQQLLHESKFIGFGEGSSWGEFLRPQGVTTNGSLVFCSDSRNNRVACWNKDTQSFSYIGKDILSLDRPAGIAAIDDYLVIVDFGNSRIHLCQNTGHHLDLFTY